MTVCSACAGPVPPSDPRPAVRSDDGVYHVGCAPAALLASASEEYQAILRKGVRYFVEKYSVPPEQGGELGTRFLELGRALESERARRGLP